jgi:hypothetical protein
MNAKLRLVEQELVACEVELSDLKHHACNMWLGGNYNDIKYKVITHADIRGFLEKIKELIVGLRGYSTSQISEINASLMDAKLSWNNEYQWNWKYLGGVVTPGPVVSGDTRGICVRQFSTENNLIGEFYLKTVSDLCSLFASVIRTFQLSWVIAESSRAHVLAVDFICVFFDPGAAEESPETKVISKFKQIQYENLGWDHVTLFLTQMRSWVAAADSFPAEQKAAFIEKVIEKSNIVVETKYRYIWALDLPTGKTQIMFSYRLTGIDCIYTMGNFTSQIFHINLFLHFNNTLDSFLENAGINSDYSLAIPSLLVALTNAHPPK